MSYPKEDKCRYCGEHLGWMLDPMGEMVALGLCGKAECREKEIPRKGDKHVGSRNDNTTSTSKTTTTEPKTGSS